MNWLKKEMYIEGFLMDKDRKIYYSENFRRHIVNYELMG